jgi:hypothetical protein
MRNKSRKNVRADKTIKEKVFPTRQDDDYNVSKSLGKLNKYGRATSHVEDTTVFEKDQQNYDNSVSNIIKEEPNYTSSRLISPSSEYIKLDDKIVELSNKINTNNNTLRLELERKIKEDKTDIEKDIAEIKEALENKMNKIQAIWISILLAAVFGILNYSRCSNYMDRLDNDEKDIKRIDTQGEINKNDIQGIKEGTINIQSEKSSK